MSTRVNTRRIISLIAICSLYSAIASFALAQLSPSGSESDQQSDLAPAEQQRNNIQQSTQRTGDAEPLVEGPIHEAFAEPLRPIVEDHVINQEPPPPIDEVPPAYRPEGENIEWIPGYWMWLKEKNGFIWISGVWRAVPPGRVWTPGHWSKEASGYRWISGFWSDLQSDEITYLPYPPESLYEGPTSPAPTENHFWIPGYWRWQNNSYAWQAGSWYPGQSNWVWNPNHYLYTPRGAVFVQGYWDYPIQGRGWLYAQVYWQNGYNFGGGYAYTPSQLVNTVLLLTALFIDSDRGYYYYGWGYSGRNNFYPWYTGYRNEFYSPLYNYYSWQYGRDSSDWKDRFARVEDSDQNPQTVLVGTAEEIRRSISDEQGSALNAQKNMFRQLTESDQKAVRARVKQLEQIRSARAEFESEKLNKYRAQLEESNDDDGNRRRTAKIEVPKNYVPSKFNFQSAVGAQEFRRLARDRYQQLEQHAAQSRNRNERREPNTRQSAPAQVRTRVNPPSGARESQQKTREVQRQNMRQFQHPPQRPQRSRVEPEQRREDRQQRNGQ